MTTERNDRVERCVEKLCSRGCEHVSACIERLQGGGLCDEVTGLDAAERAQVLDELVSVMAPYERKCGR